MRLILVPLLMTVFWANPTTESQAKSVDHPMVTKIAKINPKLTLEYRRLVVNSIHKAAHRHGVRPDKLFAILAQESKFKVGAINKKSSDYGIGQINIRNIIAYGMDQEQLLTDVEYSVDAAAFVLSHFKRYAKREAHWWTRYNSSNPEKRTQYGILVAKYIP